MLEQKNFRAVVDAFSEDRSGGGRLRLRRGLDLLIAHSPPAGVGATPTTLPTALHRVPPAREEAVPPFATARTRSPVRKGDAAGSLGTTEVHKVVGHKVLEV